MHAGGLGRPSGSIRALALVLVLFAALVASACSAPPGGRTSGVAPTSAESTDPVTIAVAGMITPKDGMAYYQDLAEYLGAKVGREVHLIHKADYADCNRMLADGKIDMAFVCSGPYASGHDEFGLELLGAPVVGASPTYHSYIIVSRSSPATSLASLKGKRFAFTDPLSNSGRAVPTFMLLKMGTTPEAFFGRWFYTYSHDNSIKAVTTGQADGAAVDSLIYDYYTATKPSMTAGTRVIATSDPYAIPPVVVRPRLDPELKERLRDALLSVHEDAAGREILRKMRIARFVPIEDGAYDSVRAMLRAIDASAATATP